MAKAPAARRAAPIAPVKDTEASTTSKFAGPKESAPVVEKLSTEKEELKAELYKKIQAVLMEHDGLESNIGVNHDYWGWVNQVRGLK